MRLCVGRLIPEVLHPRRGQSRHLSPRLSDKRMGYGGGSRRVACRGRAGRRARRSALAYGKRAFLNRAFVATSGWKPPLLGAVSGTLLGVAAMFPKVFSRRRRKPECHGARSSPFRIGRVRGCRRHRLSRSDWTSSCRASMRRFSSSPALRSPRSSRSRRAVAARGSSASGKFGKPARPHRGRHFGWKAAH